MYISLEYANEQLDFLQTNLFYLYNLAVSLTRKCTKPKDNSCITPEIKSIMAQRA